MAEAVVGGPLVLVAEDVVGAANRLELRACAVVGVDVGVELAGPLAVGLLEVRLCRVLVDAEEVVEVFWHTG